MKILLIGSGGREHAIAEALSRSPAGGELVIAPGNPGTAALGRNVPVSLADVAAIAALAEAEAADLVVVGPEAPLALGLADELAARGIACFGPSRAAAALESSKAFAKATMASLGVPTADYRVCTDFDEAAAFVRAAPWPLVVKASGLASGKGVVLPDSAGEAVGALHAMMRGGRLGDAAREVVVEERLEGEELSLMAFCDGSRLALMPGARDHKRLLDGDRGPNTGGMGAYAPACTTELAAEYARLTMEPLVDLMRARGTPFVGVLYAGLIVTPSGPKVLEYNCRFGDPEAQAVLALFAGDLAATMAACAAGDLRKAPPSWKTGAAACVVMAGDGYPERPVGGAVLSGLEPVADGRASVARVLHANTRLEGGRLVSGGGRVLSVVAAGDKLPEAVAAAYAKADEVSFPGARYRRDIGARELARLAADKPRRSSAYASSGVDIDAGNEAVRRMSAAVKATYSEAVLAGIGSFGGLYDATSIKTMAQPVLVASTDGVGTKVKLAAQAGSYASIGQDIVNHCIDDILVQGARPLMFLDYFASSRLDPAMVAEAVGGMAAACRAAGCALIGGETAEMPGVYRDGEFDVAGTILGVVERGSILPAAGVGPGDALVGFASSGPHTNGYSLARKAFESVDLSTVYPELGRPLGEALLAPHRSYLPLLWPVLSGSPGLVKALAHITGGGFIENLPRVLPDGVDAVVRRGSWPVPPLYGRIERLGRVEPDEMYRVFNMGVGMVAVVDSGRVDELRALVGEECWVIGELVGSAQGGKARARLDGERA